MCEVDGGITQALRTQAVLALEGDAKESIKLSVMLGHVEHAITQKSGATCPSSGELQVCTSA